MPKIMTIISDFGTSDGYVGSLKGLTISAESDIDFVDITHDIDPFNIGEGAFCIFNCHSWFPAGSAHVVIVDPGVGSDRRILFIEANEQVFIGPDNGVFDPIVYLYDNYRCYEIDKSKFKNVGATFHGRDVFIPAAIKYLQGTNCSEFCTPCDYAYKILTDEMMAGLTAVSLHTDHFGNIITALNKVKLNDRVIRSLQFEQIEIPFVHFYDEGNLNEPVCLFGSSGLLEVAINRGSAKAFFKKRWDGVPAEFEINWKE